MLDALGGVTAGMQHLRHQISKLLKQLSAGYDVQFVSVRCAVSHWECRNIITWQPSPASCLLAGYFR